MQGSLGDREISATVARLRDLTQGGTVFGKVVALGAAAIPALEILLRGPATPIYQPRCLAADALAALRGDEALAALIRAFEDSVHRQLDPVLAEAETMVLSHVAEILGRKRDRRAIDPLLRALERRPYAAMAQALGVLGDPRAVPLLLYCLYDDSARTAAQEALRSFGALSLSGLCKVLPRRARTTTGECAGESRTLYTAWRSR